MLDQLPADVGRGPDPGERRRPTAGAELRLRLHQTATSASQGTGGFADLADAATSSPTSTTAWRCCRASSPARSRPSSAATWSRSRRAPRTRRSRREFITWVLSDEAQLEGLAKNNIIPSRTDLADNEYFKDKRVGQATAKALGVGYVPWVFHFNDMVNSDSSPWIQHAADRPSSTATSTGRSTTPGKDAGNRQPISRSLRGVAAPRRRSARTRTRWPLRWANYRREWPAEAERAWGQTMNSVSNRSSACSTSCRRCSSSPPSCSTRWRSWSIFR